jgi:hypothetical protein
MMCLKMKNEKADFVSKLHFRGNFRSIFASHGVVHLTKVVIFVSRWHKRSPKVEILSIE